MNRAKGTGPFCRIRERMNSLSPVLRPQSPSSPDGRRAPGTCPSSVKPEPLLAEQSQARARRLGIIEDAALLPYFLEGRFDGLRGPVGAVRSDRLHHIGDGEDPRLTADLRTL